MRQMMRRVIRTGVLVLLVSAAASCASSQATAHPQLSSLGRVVATAETLNRVVAAIQARTAATVATLCPGGPTDPDIACRRAVATARPIMIAAGAVGDATALIGTVFSTYLTTTDAVAKATAERNLAAQIRAVEVAVTQLVALVPSEATALARAITQIQTSVHAATKGQP